MDDLPPGSSHGLNVKPPYATTPCQKYNHYSFECTFQIALQNMHIWRPKAPDAKSIIGECCDDPMPQVSAVMARRKAGFYCTRAGQYNQSFTAA
jgi:hypothetical protein